MRPVIDLEPHYESTHHSFDVSPTRATFRLMDTVSDVVLFQSQQPTRPVWGAADIRNGGYQAVSSGLHGRPIMELAHRISLGRPGRSSTEHAVTPTDATQSGVCGTQSSPFTTRLTTWSVATSLYDRTCSRRANRLCLCLRSPQRLRGTSNLICPAPSLQESCKRSSSPYPTITAAYRTTRSLLPIDTKLQRRLPNLGWDSSAACRGRAGLWSTCRSADWSTSTCARPCPGAQGIELGGSILGSVARC